MCGFMANVFSRIHLHSYGEDAQKLLPTIAIIDVRPYGRSDVHNQRLQHDILSFTAQTPLHSYVALRYKTYSNISYQQCSALRLGSSTNDSRATHSRTLVGYTCTGTGQETLKHHPAKAIINVGPYCTCL